MLSKNFLDAKNQKQTKLLPLWNLKMFRLPPFELKSRVSMSIRSEDEVALAALESRVKAILPEQYQDRYEDIQPQSMGSAGLKYGADGNVAWDQMWATFCDLALGWRPTPQRNSSATSDTHRDRGKF